MCPICILSAMVFGPGLIAACGVNGLAKLRGRSGDAEADGALTLGLNAEAGADAGETDARERQPAA